MANAGCQLLRNARIAVRLLDKLLIVEIVMRLVSSNDVVISDVSTDLDVDVDDLLRLPVADDSVGANKYGASA